MAAPIFTIQPGNGMPIYRQIVEEVKSAIASGRLKAGEKLPTHRDLARDLVIAPLTVKKAYDALQAEGLIAMTQGRGTFVAERGGRPGREAREELDARAEGLVRQARLPGLTPSELRKLIESRWGKGK